LVNYSSYCLSFIEKENNKMKNIEKIQIGKERIYLKKSAIGWGIVYPIKNEDGSINWFNLLTGGSWWNLGIVLFIVIIILGCVYEYSNTVRIANKCLEQLNVIGGLRF